MYKNQLQELAQRSCFNLPAYACIREGPDHAPRFKATVIFNGETFESPNYCNTLRHAEHAAAEVALCTLSRRGPSQALAKRILDETSVCKNLLQETAQRAGVSLPTYTTIRSGPGHLPVFTSMVEVAGMNFTGEAAKTKKQAEKNAAMAAWSSLRQFANQGNSTFLPTESEDSEEQEQNTIARALAKAHFREDNVSFLLPKQQLALTNRPHTQRTLLSSPSRMRLLPSGSDTPASVSPGGMKKHQSRRSPGELNEPPQNALLCNQPHSNLMVAGVHPYHFVNAYPGQISLQGSVRCHSSGLSREAMAANRATACTVKPVVLTQSPGLAFKTTKDRHEVSIPTKEHQQDEDEWLRGSLRVSEDAQEINHDHFPSSNTAYDTIWSHASDPWWSYHSSPSSVFLRDHRFPIGASLAPPVRVRSVTAVCAAPSSHASLRQLEPEQRVGGDASGDERTCEALRQLRI